MHATRFLTAQHRDIAELIDQLRKTKVDRAAKLEKLVNELVAHMTVEQDIFYPAVRAAAPRLVDDSFEEHAMAEIALDRLVRAGVDDPSFAGKVDALAGLFIHHVREEEELLFVTIEKTMSMLDIDALGERMSRALVAARRKRHVPHRAPRTSADEARKHGARTTKARHQHAH